MNAIANIFKRRDPACRDALKAAVAALEDAKRVLAGAKAATARVQDAVDAAHLARRHAVKARSEAGQAAEGWLSSGANPDDQSGHEQLEKLALQAEREAQKAEALSHGAKKGLAAVRDREDIAAKYVKSAQAAVEAEIGEILLHRNAQLLTTLEESAATYQAARLEVTALSRTVQGRAATSIREILSRTKIPPPYEPNPVNGPIYGVPPPLELVEREKVWNERVKLLRENPDAEI